MKLKYYIKQLNDFISLTIILLKEKIKSFNALVSLKYDVSSKYVCITILINLAVDFFVLQKRLKGFNYSLSRIFRFKVLINKIN